MALVIRAELAQPGMQFVSNEQYNQLFTMHGTIMLFLFATPLFVGFGNVIMPLQIGAPDVAFPRLNMLSYWFFLFGGIIVVPGLPDPGGAADFGWFAYAPLSTRPCSPGVGARPLDHGPGPGWPRHDPRRGQLHHDHLLHARTRHDHVPDADLHVEHPASPASSS